MATETVASVGWTWLRAHERIVIVALCLAFGTFGISKFYDVTAARKDANYIAAQQIASEAQKNSAALALQAAQTQAQYAALVQALTAQNAALASSIAQRTASGNTQRAVDATLSTVELAGRWNVIAGTQVAVSGSTVLVQDTDAHKTVDMLEQVPVLTQNLAEETKIAQNLQLQAERSDTLTGMLNSQITGLNTQIDAQAKACTAQVAAVKAEGHKNSVKWFKRGFIVGFVAGLWAGHSAGL